MAVSPRRRPLGENGAVCRGASFSKMEVRFDWDGQGVQTTEACLFISRPWGTLDSLNSSWGLIVVVCECCGLFLDMHRPSLTIAFGSLGEPTVAGSETTPCLV